MKSSKNLVRFLILLFLLYTYAFPVTRKIDLAVTDLGRHLKNGELFVRDFRIPQMNLYSYTCPDYPFVNHHWASGAVFYLVKAFSGFSGLSVFFLLLSMATFFLFFHIAWKYSSFETASLTAAFVIPAMAGRFHVRPEAFSYFFLGVFFWILYNWRDKRIGSRLIYILPFLEALWVNLHIYFFTGIILIAVFFAECLIRDRAYRETPLRHELKQISAVFAASLAATLLNPAFIKGALYPFMIMGNFGIDTLDLQSFSQLVRCASAGFDFPPLFYFSVALVIFLLSWAPALLEALKGKREFPFVNLTLGAFFLFMASSAARNFTIFAYFALPITAINLRGVFKKDTPGLLGRLLVFLSVILISFSLFLAKPQFWPDRKTFGIGLEDGMEDAAGLWRNEKIHGPVFNNFDTGGYLIYYLYPGQRVFIDNRPEAYPAGFKQMYIACQEDEGQWRALDKVYNFNAIFFSPHVGTPRGQGFILRRLLDPLWAPVYVDERFIIFLKKEGPNQDVVKRRELSREMFFAGP